MPTCLFTERETGTPSTKEEHTIPRALGGRYRSRTVSSTEFNEQCSKVVDPYLIGPYRFICNALGPLLSREHEPGSIRVSVRDAPGRYVVEAGGALRRTDLCVSRDANTGLPNTVTGGDEEALRRFARQQGWDENKIEFEPIPGAPGSPGLVADGIRLRLERMYRDRITAEHSESKFDKILQHHLQHLNEAVRSELIAREDPQAIHVSWTKWIQVHRAILTDLEAEFGLPGAMSEPLCVFKNQADLKLGELLAWQTPEP